MNYMDIVTEITILMIYVLIGFILRRINLVTENGVRDISRVIVNVAMPAMILNAMNMEYEQEYVINMGIIALSAFIFLLFTVNVSRIIVNRLPLSDREKSPVNYSLIFGNLAFLGYPICSALFGQIGMFYAAIYVVVQNLFQWTVGVNIYKREKIRLSNLKNLINPGTVAISIGLITFFFNVRPPEILDRVIKGVGGIAVPLGLIMVGASLYGHNIFQIATDRRVLFVTLMKTLVFPLVFVAVLSLVPIDKTLKSILTIQAAAPVQATGTVFAKNFNADSSIVAMNVFFSTITCLITIPIFLVVINL